MLQTEDMQLPNSTSNENINFTTCAATLILLILTHCMHLVQLMFIQFTQELTWHQYNTITNEIILLDQQLITYTLSLPIIY